MRRKVTIAVLIIITFVLQNTVFQSLRIASISPNLLAILASSFGFMRGKKEGLWVGFFCGLCIDLFYGSYLGFYALIYMYIGYVNGCFRRMFYPEDIKLPMLLISASDLVLNLIVYILLYFMRGNFHFTYYLAHIIIPELIYTILITIPYYFILLKINQKLESIEKRSAAKFV